jgi:hypothetical protein
MNIDPNDQTKISQLLRLCCGWRKARCTLRRRLERPT